MIDTTGSCLPGKMRRSARCKKHTDSDYLVQSVQPAQIHMTAVNNGPVVFPGAREQLMAGTHLPARCISLQRRPIMDSKMPIRAPIDAPTRNPIPLAFPTRRVSEFDFPNAATRAARSDATTPQAPDRRRILSRSFISKSVASGSRSACLSLSRANGTTPAQRQSTKTETE